MATPEARAAQSAIDRAAANTPAGIELRRQMSEAARRHNAARVSYLLGNSQANGGNVEVVALEERILAFLACTGPSSALQVAQSCFGDGATKSRVNPTLYRLVSDGRVVVNDEVTPPIWSLPHSPQALAILEFLRAEPQSKFNRLEVAGALALALADVTTTLEQLAIVGEVDTELWESPNNEKIYYSAASTV